MTTPEISQLIARIGMGGYRDGSSTQPGRPYQPIPFPEFEGLSAQKGSQVQKEGDTLMRHLRNLRIPSPRTVLDIGANVGYHSFCLAQQLGSNVVAVEQDPANLQVIQALAQWSGWAVWGVESIEDAMRGDTVFDLTLMLNVHHWIHKQRGPAATLDLMRRLAHRTRLLFFQTAHRGSGSFYCVEEVADAKGVGDYLIQAGFTDPRLVAETEHAGKPRYLFTAQGSSMSRPA